MRLVVQGRTFFSPTLRLTLLFTARDSVFRLVALEGQSPSDAGLFDLPASPKKRRSYPSYSPTAKSIRCAATLFFGGGEKKGKGRERKRKKERKGKRNIVCTVCLVSRGQGGMV